MKLYYGRGACSLSPHIVLREAGIPFELEQVDIRNGKFSGGDFTKINPKGYVPALELHNGQILTEGATILQYLADFKPDSNLMPKQGTMERYRCMEWLTFISSEIHKGFSPLFSSQFPAEVKGIAKDALGKRLDFVNRAMAGNKYLMGDQFTVADAYLFTVLNWSDFVGIDLKPWSALVKFMEQMKQREHVQAALKAEGLLK
jgi:glutathione S-transferase